MKPELVYRTPIGRQTICQQWDDSENVREPRKEVANMPFGCNLSPEQNLWIVVLSQMVRDAYIVVAFGDERDGHIAKSEIEERRNHFLFICEMAGINHEWLLNMLSKKIWNMQ